MRLSWIFQRRKAASKRHTRALLWVSGSPAGPLHAFFTWRGLSSRTTLGRLPDNCQGFAGLADRARGRGKEASIVTTTQRVFNGRFRPVWISAAVYLGVSAALRITLWASFGRPAGTSLPDLAAIVSLGVINDLVMLVGLLFPLTLGLALA